MTQDPTREALILAERALVKTEVMRDDFGKVMGHVLVEPLSLRDEAQPSAPTADTGAGKLSADELDEIYASARDRFLHDNDGAQLSNHVAHLTGLRAVEARAAQDTGSGEGWFVRPEWRAAGDEKADLFICRLHAGSVWRVYLPQVSNPDFTVWAAHATQASPDGVFHEHYPTREEAQAALLSAVSPKDGVDRAVAFAVELAAAPSPPVSVEQAGKATAEQIERAAQALAQCNDEEWANEDGAEFWRQAAERALSAALQLSVSKE